MVTEEEIKQKLSKYFEPVRYSQFRKEFDLNDPTFLDRFCFLITVGEIVIYGYSEEKTEFPKEAEAVRRIQMQLGETKHRKLLWLEEYDPDSDPYIIYRENLRKVYTTKGPDLRDI